MSRLEFTPLAEQDLWQILEFIAKDSSVAGISFVERLRAKCELLAAQPLMGQARPEFAKGEYRCITFGHYVVYYRPLLDGVVIARVLHGARDHDALID